jgi:hypothetical protein
MQAAPVFSSRTSCEHTESLAIQSTNQPYGVNMSNHDAKQDLLTDPQAITEREPGRTVSAAAPDEQNALLRALLVRGISGAMNGIGRTATPQ